MMMRHGLCVWGPLYVHFGEAESTLTNSKEHEGQLQGASRDIRKVDCNRHVAVVTVGATEDNCSIILMATALAITIIIIVTVDRCCC